MEGWEEQDMVFHLSSNDPQTSVQKNFFRKKVKDGGPKDLSLRNVYSSLSKALSGLTLTWSKHASSGQFPLLSTEMI